MYPQFIIQFVNSDWDIILKLFAEPRLVKAKYFRIVC